MSVSGNARVWVGVFYCNMTNQAVEAAKQNVLKKNYFIGLYVAVVLTIYGNQCLLGLSEIDLLLWLQTTWLQVDQRRTMEAFHWTLTTCICSCKVSLFLYFCCCEHVMCCSGESVMAYICIAFWSFISMCLAVL